MIENLYKYFRWLSLDIVLGAIVFLAYLEKHFNLSISFHIYFELSAAIWIIYTTDHLIDSSRSIVSERRKFHRKNANKLIVVGSCVLMLALINVYFLPEDLIRNGSMLAAGCVAYLTIVYYYRKLWFKELLVAFGYTCGIFLSPYTQINNFQTIDFLLAFQLFVVALINLVLFSYFDAENDKRDQFESLVSKIDLNISRRIIYGLSALSSIISVFGMVNTQLFGIYLVYFIMTGLLFSMLFLPAYLEKNERFRVMGDGVFFVPIIFIW